MANTTNTGDNTSNSREKFDYYSLRMPRRTLNRLRELADEETKRQDLPIPVAAICRRFINEGIARATKKA